MRIISTKFSNFVGIHNLKKSIINNDNNVETITHIPVLAKEITKILSPKDGQFFLDLTFGGGGHTKYLLSTNKKITIFTLDRDHQAFERAVLLAKKIEQNNCGQKIVPLLGRFSQMNGLLQKIAIPYHSFDGAIIDLGASSFQYDDPVRGFSFRDGPLDMRMDGDRNPQMPSAADVINTLNADELARIFKVYGEERNAKKIAQTIVDSRFLMKRINTTRELAEMVQSIVTNANISRDKIGRTTHPATKIFQALRIFVNNELNELNHVIPVLSRYLKISKPESYNEDDDNGMIANERHNGGLLAIIAFHSLEDKIIKSHFVDQAGNNLVLPPKSDDYIIHPNNNYADQTKRLKIWKFYQKKFQVPTEEEILQNPRARSAKLRLGLRINH